MLAGTIKGLTKPKDMSPRSITMFAVIEINITPKNIIGRVTVIDMLPAMLITIEMASSSGCLNTFNGS